jgi:hypothetical protein
VLTDEQIDRYSRQLLLPEFGSRTQERFLGSTVEIRGRGAPLRLCAAWLAGAGIGRLVVPRRDSEDPCQGILREADFRERNPDTRVVTEPCDDADAVVVLGPLDPQSPIPNRAIVLCGVETPDEVRWMRLAPGEASAARADAFLGSAAAAGKGLLLATILALEALLALADIERGPTAFHKLRL